MKNEQGSVLAGMTLIICYLLSPFIEAFEQK
jgi:hypothetical protein